MKLVKFYSQIVNWNGDISEFPSLQEKNKWENNACGIACIRMVINSFLKEGIKEQSYWSLLQLALNRNAYCEKGWIHKELLEILKAFKLDGRCHRNKTMKDVVDAIDSGSICIVSVTKCFSGGKLSEAGFSLPKGGHLVVAYSTCYKKNKIDSIICNHPSSADEWNKAGWSVNIEKWINSFSGNFIEVIVD
ncbi:MAG: C39 family peptidase [Bacteroidales bacterium]|jgi:hypothetical protein|nr:C39 family peptidase [Bacteroidales bacterium]